MIGQQEAVDRHICREHSFRAQATLFACEIQLHPKTSLNVGACKSLFTPIKNPWSMCILTKLNRNAGFSCMPFSSLYCYHPSSFFATLTNRIVLLPASTMSDMSNPRAYL